MVARLSSLCKLKAMGSWAGKRGREAGQGRGAEKRGREAGQRSWPGVGKEATVVVQTCLQYPWLHLNYEHPHLTCAVESEGKVQGKV